MENLRHFNQEKNTNVIVHRRTVGLDLGNGSLVRPGITRHRLTRLGTRGSGIDHARFRGLQQHS